MEETFPNCNRGDWELAEEPEGSGHWDVLEEPWLCHRKTWMHASLLSMLAVALACAQPLVTHGL